MECRICNIIRYFLVSVVFLIIISLTLTDHLEYLSFITTWNVAIVIMTFGCVSLIIKIIFYYIKKRKLTVSEKSNK